MAHADYDCCAICDSKLDYNYEAKSKDKICTVCLKALRSNDVNVLDIDEFINWVNSTDKPKLLTVLKKIGFSFCYYNNLVDDAVNLRIPEYKRGLHK